MTKIIYCSLKLQLILCQYQPQTSQSPAKQEPFGEPVHEALFFMELNDITTAG